MDYSEVRIEVDFGGDTVVSLRRLPHDQHTDSCDAIAGALSETVLAINGGFEFIAVEQFAKAVSSFDCLEGDMFEDDPMVMDIQDALNVFIRAAIDVVLARAAQQKALNETRGGE